MLGEGDYEIEDLMPVEELAKVFSKKYRGDSTDDFEYIYDRDKPIVDQMNSFATKNGYVLGLGWKVEIAKEFQKIFDRIASKLTDDLVNKWVALFNKIK